MPTLDAVRAAIVVPHTVRRELADGRWIEIKARLNHGEYVALYQSLYEERNGEWQRNPLLWSDKMVIAYLVDWNLPDASGEVLPIRGQAPAVVQATLNNLEEDDFQEIKDVIEMHANAIAAERAEKKRRRNMPIAS